LLAVTVAISRLNDRRTPESLARPLAEIPAEISGWQGIDDAPLRQEVARALGATSYLSRTYRRADRNIHLFVAYYANPRAGETMHSPKHCLPGGGWEPIEFATVRVPLDTGDAEVNQYTLYRAGQRAVVLYWYQTPSRVTASEYVSKARLIWDSLWYRRTASAIVRLTVGATPTDLADGIQFAAHVMREVAKCYRR
jgi:EpsI family protein